MTRNLTSNCPFSFVAPFIAILIVLIAAVALAQVTRAGQPIGKPNLAPTLLRANPSAQALEHPQRLRSGNAAPVLALHSQSNRPGVAPMDAMPPLFLSVLIYGSGGSNAVSVAAADLNGDGKPDLVAANQDNPDYFGSVGVLLGNGDGTFQPAITYDSGGGQPLSLAVADVNRDGKQDVLVVNLCADFDCQGIGSVGVLLGNGDGTFQKTAPFDSVGQIAIAVADLNGDGNGDVVVSGMHFGLNIVGVHLGNGDGTFGPGVIYDAAGDTTRAVAVADVNGDGKPDVVAASLASSNVSVLLGNGDGTLQSAVSYGSGGSGAFAVAVTDVNGDGMLDVLVANQASNIGVLLGNGDGTFQQAVSYGSGGPADSVSVADVNGDGKADLLVADFVDTESWTYGMLGVLLGNGDGTFQPVVTYHSGGVGAFSVAEVDANCDGRPDAAVVNFNADNYNAMGTVGVLLNNAGATQTTIVSSRNPAAPHQLVTYTATVMSQYGGELTGTVTFKDKGVLVGALTLANRQAAVSTRYSGAGSHVITATYSGDTNVNGSTSDALTENIKGTSKTVTTTSGSPSFVGQSVTFTAIVTSGYGKISDGEWVTFYDGKTPLSSVALARGTAAYTTSALPAKTHTIKATYGGDATFLPSTGRVTQVVVKHPTTTVLTSSPNPSTYGQPVTFTATVVPAGPYALTGKVTFKDGTTAIGTAALSGGVATLTKSKLTVGTHPITAQYLGDAASAKSASSVLNQVVQ